MFTLIQHILLDQEGGCTRKVMTAVEKICCGLSYLYVKLRQSLKQLGQSLSVQRLWVGAHNSAGIPRTLRTNGRTRNEKGVVGREA